MLGQVLQPDYFTFSLLIQNWLTWKIVQLKVNSTFFASLPSSPIPCMHKAAAESSGDSISPGLKRDCLQGKSL